MYSVLSTGPNFYGYPGLYALARLKGSGTTIYCTDRNGTITATLTTGGGIAPDYGVAHTTLGRYFVRPDVAEELKRAEQRLRAEQKARSPLAGRAEGRTGPLAGRAESRA